MNSTAFLIEPLEARQMLSATPDAGMLSFQGSANYANGTLIDKLLVNLQPVPTGFTGEVIMTNPAGDISTDPVTLNSAGEFSKIGTGFTITGKMNAAETKVTGNWTLQAAQKTSKGSLNLTLIPPPNPALPTTNKRTTITDHSGTDTNQNNVTSNVTIEVIDTNGVRTGEVNVHNYDGVLTPIPFKIASNGTIAFTFSFSDQTNIVQAKLSADGTTITGSWTSINTNGTNGFGTMLATEV